MFIVKKVLKLFAVKYEAKKKFQWRKNITRPSKNELKWNFLRSLSPLCVIKHDRNLFFQFESKHDPTKECTNSAKLLNFSLENYDSGFMSFKKFKFSNYWKIFLGSTGAFNNL